MADDRDTLKAASRALADAAAQLTRALGTQARQHLPEVGEVIAQGLREAALELADVSDSMDKKSGKSDARRRSKVDRTRADLLDAAAGVFSAKGFEGASVDDVATEAGYTKGAVYAHFGSKRDLFLAVARSVLDAESAGEHRLPGVTAEGVDVAALEDALAASAQDPRLLLSIELLAYALRHPGASEELEVFYARAFDALASHVADVRRAREARAGHDVVPGVTEHDRDTTLGVVAVLNVAPFGVRLLGEPYAGPAAGARVIARLLEG
jgi:AcrR family transcriptional regulator